MSDFALIAPGTTTDPTVTRVFEEIERELGFGMVPNVFRAMAAHPALLDANWAMFRATVLHGRLPRILKEMVGVVVSAVHQSRYARLVHLHSLGLQGVNGDALAALAEGNTEAPGLSPSTTAVLRFARDAATRPAGLAAADYEALFAAGVPRDALLEIVGTIQAFTAINLFTDVAEVPVDGA